MTDFCPLGGCEADGGRGRVVTVAVAVVVWLPWGGGGGRGALPGKDTGGAALGSSSSDPSSPRLSTLAAGEPKRPESIASLVRIDGVNTRPVNSATHPKLSAAGCEIPPGWKLWCAWHCAASDMGSSSERPSAAAAFARRRAWAWAMTRINCNTPDVIIENRCAGQK
eukprot:scaffold24547_cov57-Phaeocystis_antarctica.AAC.2